MMLSSGLKGQFTVVGCVSAAGFCLPPFVIIDRKRFNPAFAEGEVPGTAYGLSHNGWMDQELFHLWFKDHFLKYIPTTRPVILLMDGHRSHYNPETIRFASKNGVVLFTLPPNTTHMSQPLDRSCFGPLKTAWREVCHRFMCNSGQTVSRFSFSHLLHEAWDIAMTRKNIISGFKVTGIFPFDRKALVPEPEDDTSPYLPLLTPRRHTNRRVIVDDVTLDNSHFSNDISDSSFESSLTLLPRRSSFSEMLRYPSPIPVPKSNPQSKESRVLTSDENLKRIEEKEREREEIAKEKARKKELREQRKLDKANNNKKRVINDKSDDKADPVTCDQFSAEEIQLFRKRFDNGYDLEHDARYNEWKKKFAMQHDSLEQSSNESTYEDWMFTQATAEKTPDTLTQPRCTLKKTADVIDSWHRSALRKPATNDGIIMEKAECTVCHGYYAVTSSGTIRLHGPQSDRCPGSRQPIGIESDLSNSPVTPPLPSSPSPHQPHSIDLEKTSSTVPIVKRLPNTVTNNDIIKRTSIRTLKTSTSTNDNTQPKVTLRNNATNDDTHKKTAAIDDITQPRHTFEKTATDSRKETTTNNDITQPRHRTATGSLKKTATNDDITQSRHRTATGSLKKTATNDDITQPRHRTATGSLKKTATNDDITQPRRTLRSVTNFLKKNAANDDITQTKCTVKPATSLKKTAANNDLKCTLKKCKHPYAQNWIQCSVCEAWHHCICMGTTLKKAEKITFTCCQ